MHRRQSASGKAAHPRARQREGPNGYKLSRSDDEGDVGRDEVSNRERNLPEADCHLRYSGSPILTGSQPKSWYMVTGSLFLRT